MSKLTEYWIKDIGGPSYKVYADSIEQDVFGSLILKIRGEIVVQCKGWISFTNMDLYNKSCEKDF